MQFDGDPRTFKGFTSWIVLGFIAGGVALLVGTMFPKVIPARASQVRL